MLFSDKTDADPASPSPGSNRLSRGLKTPLGEVLRVAVEALSTAHDSARLDAEVLLAHVLGAPRHLPYAHPEAAVEGDQLRRYRRLVDRRRAGEPVAYLTGRREFWALDLAVTPDTLIPRPETEHLVEAALAHIPPGAAWRIGDIGTGCGAVALALAGERPTCTVVGSDISGPALDVATGNANRLNLDNVQFQLGDGCDALRDCQYEVIVSNPPYLADSDPHLRNGEIRFEPRLALVAGPDGLKAIRALAKQAQRRLVPEGHLLFEHGFDQGKRVRGLLTRLGYVRVTTHRDYAGHERVTEGRSPGLRHGRRSGCPKARTVAD